MITRSRLRWAVVLFVAVSMPLATPAETKYRQALNKYWKKQFKEDGFSPLYYASTTHAPKSVWVKKGKVLDYFESGQDLYPEEKVPTHVAEIDLPEQRGEKSTRISALLHLLGTKDVNDARFETAVDSNLSWVIESGEAELHYFSKRKARECERTETADVRAGYFADLNRGEQLYVVVKAVYVRDYRVKVLAGASMEAGLTGGLATLLESFGFKVARDKRTATSQKARDKFVAVGLRRLDKEDGLMMLAGEEPGQEQEPALIPFPESYVESVD
jgi:hypothetical protein